MPPKKRKAVDAGQRTLAFRRGGKITAKGAYQPTLRGMFSGRAPPGGAAAAPVPAAAPAPEFLHWAAAPPAAGGDDTSEGESPAAAAASPAAALEQTFVHVKAEARTSAAAAPASRRASVAPPTGRRGTLDAYLPEHAARASELQRRGAQQAAAAACSAKAAVSAAAASAQRRAPSAHPQLVVTAVPGATMGSLSTGDAEYTCIVGRGGVAAKGGEGDGITPVGRHALGRVYYRADRCAAPATMGMPVIPIYRSSGWCDDPSDLNHYNRPVPLPHTSSTESLWLESGVYDIIVVIEFNTPAAGAVAAGAGSAIFLHVASEDWGPTAGCVAMRQGDLEEVLRRCDGETAILIRNGQQQQGKCESSTAAASAAAL